MCRDDNFYEFDDILNLNQDEKNYNCGITVRLSIRNMDWVVSTLYPR